MLVLSRKTEQAILIGTQDQIDAGTATRVLVTSIQGDKVRIGIAAPPEVVINREEVQLRIAEQSLADAPLAAPAAEATAEDLAEAIA